LGENTVSQELKEKTALISLFANIMLAVIKLIFALISNASLLLLDAIHSITDSLSAILAYSSIRLQTQEKDKTYGIMHQLENIASIIISFIIFFGAYEVYKRAINPSLIFANKLPSYPIAIAGAIFAMLVCYVISKYETRIGEKTKSNALTSDGKEWRMDMYSSLVVLISLVGSLIGIQLNKIAGIIIALFIVKVGVEVLMKGLSSFISELYDEMDGENSVKRQDGKTFLDSAQRLFNHTKRAWKYAIVALVLIYFVSGVYVVEPDEQALVKRFGSYVGVKSNPGLHYHMPYPVEAVMKVKVTSSYRAELGFRLAQEPYAGLSPELWESSHSSGGYQKVLDESLMISGDENIVDVNTVVQYRISDAEKFAFNSREPHMLLRDVMESVLRQVIGGKDIDDALTSGKIQIQDEAKEKAQEILDDYECGLEIVEVQLQDVHPPSEVAQAFKDVASAREDKNRIINDAMAYQKDVIPKARGESEKILLEAQAYSTKKVNLARGDTERFLKIYEAYRENEEITRTRLYLETMEQVLPNTRIYIVDSSAVAGQYSTLLPLMDLKTTVVAQPQSSTYSEDYGFGGYSGVSTISKEGLYELMDESPTFL